VARWLGAAASDGLGLVGADERCHGEHRRQCHEQAENCFAHCLLLCFRDLEPLEAVTDFDALTSGLVVEKLRHLTSASTSGSETGSKLVI
jgi:hypothetical protein